MGPYVDIAFDCLPLRSVGRLDVPLDASGEFRERCERIKQALEKHGSLNSYFLYNATCTYHLTNDDEHGAVEFGFQGTLLTDAEDRKSASCDLAVALNKETCDWLTDPIVKWLEETVSKSVLVEFDRYIASGNLEKTRQRVQQLQDACEQSGGFLGMYL